MLLRVTVFNITVVLFVVLASFCSLSIKASPTSNEFVACEKLAVARLDYCLKDVDGRCWSKSKASYDACRKDVIQRHIPDPEQIKAKQKRLDEYKKKNIN